MEGFGRVVANLLLSDLTHRCGAPKCTSNVKLASEQWSNGVEICYEGNELKDT